MKIEEINCGDAFGVNDGPLRNYTLVLIEKGDTNCIFYNYALNKLHEVSNKNVEESLNLNVPHLKFIDLTKLYKLETLPEDIFEAVKANVSHLKPEAIKL